MMEFMKEFFEKVDFEKIHHMKYYRPPDKSAYWKIIFFISHPKHILLVLKRTVSGCFEHPNHMFKLMGKKMHVIEFLRK